MLYLLVRTLHACVSLVILPFSPGIAQDEKNVLLKTNLDVEHFFLYTMCNHLVAHSIRRI